MIPRKAIILAGGAGTRLFPVTHEIPKPLITVGRKPIINYLLQLFRDHGVREVKIIIRPQDREEFDWWLTRWRRSFSDVTIAFEEELKPMGTIGYTVHFLSEWVRGEPFFLTNGDELKEVNLTAMTAAHAEGRGLATIALVRVPNPEEYGVAVLDGPRIIKFLEKPKEPPTNLISSGLYLMEPAALSYLKSHVQNGTEFLMLEKDLFPQLALGGKLTAYESAGRWYDCGSFERWERAIKEWTVQEK